MLPIAGQTAGPIGLKFLVDTHGWPGGVSKEKNFLNFFSKLKKKSFFQKYFPRATPGRSLLNY